MLPVDPEIATFFLPDLSLNSLPLLFGENYFRELVRGSYAYALEVGKCAEEQLAPADAVHSHVLRMNVDGSHEAALALGASLDPCIDREQKVKGERVVGVDEWRRLDVDLAADVWKCEVGRNVAMEQGGFGTDKPSRPSWSVWEVRIEVPAVNPVAPECVGPDLGTDFAW
jgi:hypothetical protein